MAQPDGSEKKMVADFWAVVSNPFFSAKTDERFVQSISLVKDHLVEAEISFSRSVRNKMFIRFVVLIVCSLLFGGYQIQQSLSGGVSVLLICCFLVVVGRTSFVLHRNDLAKEFLNVLTDRNAYSGGDNDNFNYASEMRSPLHTLGSILQFRFLWNPTEVSLNGRIESRIKSAKIPSVETLTERAFLLASIDTAVFFLVVRIFF